MQRCREHANLYTFKRDMQLVDLSTMLFCKTLCTDANYSLAAAQVGSHSYSDRTPIVTACRFAAASTHRLDFNINNCNLQYIKSIFYVSIIYPLNSGIKQLTVFTQKAMSVILKRSL